MSNPLPLPKTTIWQNAKKIGIIGLYNIVLIGTIAVCIYLLVTKFNPSKSINTECFISETFSEEQDIPQDILDEVCGVGTIGENNNCSPDYNFLVDKLVENDFMYIDFKGDIIYNPENPYTTENEIPISWYEPWIQRGAFNCNRIISEGPSNCNCSALCSCSDCAGWRGGNIESCNSYDIPGNVGSGTKRNFRVMCNEDEDPDKCECAQGFCPVNGICVTPFETPTIDGKLCCPSCIYKKPEDGGCAGAFLCDESLPCEKQKIVEYPGTPVTCNQEISSDGEVRLVPMCADQWEIDNGVECWEDNHTDTTKSSPYVIIEPNSGGYGDLCTEESLRDSFSGVNEYECAMSCLTDGISQIECSQRCLPRLWRWYPVFGNPEGSERSFRGFILDKKTLVQYQPKDTPPLMYCPPETCIVKRDLGDYTLNYCDGCKDCEVNFDEVNSLVGFTQSSFTCETCEKCLLTVTDSDNDDEENTIVCPNMKTCTSCDRATIGNGIYDDSNVTCSCSLPQDKNDGCVFYSPNRDPYISEFKKNENDTFQVIYSLNKEYVVPYNSEETIGYDPNEYSDGLVCGALNPVTGNGTCTNTMDTGDYAGYVGFGDSQSAGITIYDKPIMCSC
jgi:hypothetical protein